MKLVTLVCSQAPNGGANWSLRLLAQRLLELHVVDSISHEPVRPVLKRTRSSHGMYVTRMFVEPLAGWRTVHVTERKTAVDWVQKVRALVAYQRYAKTKRITLVYDQLNTHALASFYAAFEPAEAAWLARKLELVHTPKHGSWLNMAEPELSVLTRQCLKRRIAKAATVTSEGMQ